MPGCKERVCKLYALRHGLLNILSRDWVTVYGVWVCNWICWTFKLWTTSDCSAIANSHSLQFTTARASSLCCVFISQLLGNVSPHNNVDPSAPGLTSSQAGFYFTIRLGVATQWLATIGAARLPRLRRGDCLPPSSNSPWLWNDLA
jgi:hypothetical protein